LIFIFLISIFHHWRMAVRWKSRKFWNCQDCPRPEIFIFNGKDFPCFNQISFFLHPRIWLEVIYNDSPNLDVFHDLKKRVAWANETILVKSHLWVKMKTKMGIKQHAHVSTQWPLPLYGNAMVLKHMKCRKGEKVCVLSPISWVEVLVYLKVFQNKLIVWKDVKLKSCIGHFVYCWQLFKDCTHNCLKNNDVVYCKCVVWIDIVIYLWILHDTHSYSVHPFSWMQFINDRKMNSSMDRWMTFKWMNGIHPFLNYIYLYNMFVL
jgi:hypothetical protein